MHFQTILFYLLYKNVFYSFINVVRNTYSSTSFNFLNKFLNSFIYLCKFLLGRLFDISFVNTNLSKLPYINDSTNLFHLLLYKVEGNLSKFIHYHNKKNSYPKTSTKLYCISKNIATISMYNI